MLRVELYSGAPEAEGKGRDDDEARMARPLCNVISLSPHKPSYHPRVTGEDMEAESSGRISLGPHAQHEAAHLFSSPCFQEPTHLLTITSPVPSRVSGM